MKNTLIVILIILLIAAGVYIWYQAADDETDTTTTINTNQVTNTTIPANTEPADDVTPDDMLETARDYVTANSAEGLEFDLEVTKEIDNWILYAVIPLNGETDQAMLVMENVSNVWLVRGFGTSLPDLEEQVPALFE